MKTIISVFIICSMCVFFSSPLTAQVNKEEMAIKAVIEKETTAFFQTDYKGWMDCWAHVPYAYWSLTDSSGFNTFEGWKAIEIGFTDYFVTTKPSTSKFERKWGEIRIYGNGAYARYIQYATTDGVTVVENQLRVLEKHNGQWKIVLVGVMQKMRKGNLAP